MPPPPLSGNLLDLGSGYGPIALSVAAEAPAAQVWAVDVNQRALELTRQNADRLGIRNVAAVTPDAIPTDLRFDAIYSNPPVRVGKQAMHELLEQWLSRLAPGADAFIVVHRHLGSDSLAAWLMANAFAVERLRSSSGYRVLRVHARG